MQRHLAAIKSIVKLILYVSAFLTFSVFCCHGASYTLAGTMVDPDNHPLTGRIEIQIPKAGATDVCSTPHRVVPIVRSIVNVVNGVVQGSNVALTPTDCLFPRYPYYVRIYNTEGGVNNFLYDDNWYITGSAFSLDVGTLTSAKLMAGPIVVSIPQAIISNPTGNQTITQPGSTSLTINGKVNLGTTTTVQLNQIRIADQFASVQAAITSLP